MKQVKVHCNGFEFLLEIHYSKTHHDNKIENAFYEKYHGALHHDQHVEIEVQYVRYANMQYDLAEVTKRHKLHLHPTQKDQYKGKWFICWTGHIPDKEHLEKLLELWIPGTVYSLEHHTDFMNVLGKNITPSLENSTKIKNLFSHHYGYDPELEILTHHTETNDIAA